MLYKHKFNKRLNNAVSGLFVACEVTNYDLSCRLKLHS